MRWMGESRLFWGVQAYLSVVQSLMSTRTMQRNATQRNGTLDALPLV